MPSYSNCSFSLPNQADQFLHLFLVRRERAKAFIYVIIQWPFSLVVMFCGVALKIILWVGNTVFQMEVLTRCGVDSHNKLAEHRRQLMELALDERIDKMSHHRRLASSASWPIEDLADLNFKAFLLLTISVAVVMTMSLLIGC